MSRAKKILEMAGKLQTAVDASAESQVEQNNNEFEITEEGLANFTDINVLADEISQMNVDVADQDRDNFDAVLTKFLGGIYQDNPDINTTDAIKTLGLANGNKLMSELVDFAYNEREKSLVVEESAKTNEDDDEDDDEGDSEVEGIAWAISNILDSCGEDIPDEVADMVSAKLGEVDPDGDLSVVDAVIKLPTEDAEGLYQALKSELDKAGCDYSEESK